MWGMWPWSLAHWIACEPNANDGKKRAIHLSRDNPIKNPFLSPFCSEPRRTMPLICCGALRLSSGYVNPVPCCKPMPGVLRRNGEKDADQSLAGGQQARTGRD